MPALAQEAAEIYSDFEIPGVASSGQNEPDKGRIRALWLALDATLSSIASFGTVTVAYATRAELFADLAHDAGTTGLVYDDPDAALNGFYVKSGASGAGAWTITPIGVPATFVAEFAAEQLVQDGRLDTIDAELALPPKQLVPAIPIGGNLPDGAPAYQGSWLVPPASIVDATRPELTEVGVDSVGVIPAAGAAFLYVTHNYPVVPGDWVIGSVVLEKSPTADWPALDTADIVYVGNIGVTGPQQSLAPSKGQLLFFEDLGDDMRRYVIAGQLGTAPFGSVVDAPLEASFLGVSNITTEDLKVGAYALGTSRDRVFDIDWRVFDTGRATGSVDETLESYGARLTALDGGAGDQATPQLLAPSSYFLVEGRPTRLYRAGMTPYREKSLYDFAAIGENGDQGGVVWSDGRQLVLDAETFSGAGWIAAMERAQDTQVNYRKPVTWRSTDAVSAASPTVLCIGDSLTFRGWVSKMRTRLLASGMTPALVGTFADVSGTVLTEGRASWQSGHFTFKYRWVNADGSGAIYPVRTGAGSGVTFNVTRSGGVITAITASGGSGYDNHPAMPVVIVGGGGDAAYATVAISGGVPGAVTVVAGGSGYSASPTVTMPPTVAEYLAMPLAPYSPDANAYAPRWSYNPFIRPSTGGDAAGQVFNGFIFDLDFYLARFAIADPTQIIIALGVNDILRETPTAETIDTLDILISRCQAAIGTIEVGLAFYGLPNPSGSADAFDLIEAALVAFDGREAEGIYMLPFWQMMDPKLTFDFTASATDAYGVETGATGDNIHPTTGGVGYAQAGDCAFAWIMNVA